MAGESPALGVLWPSGSLPPRYCPDCLGVATRRRRELGYARVSTDGQDLTSRQDALLALGVQADRIYLDHGLTGRSCKWR
jgi:hypothetical protein